MYTEPPRCVKSATSDSSFKGYILETSPLPKLPVTGLQPVERRKGPFHVILDHQTKEDEEINGKVTDIQYEVGYPRYPFVILLDGIVSYPVPTYFTQ